MVRENPSESYPAASKQCPLSGISFSALIRHFLTHLPQRVGGGSGCSRTRSAVSRSPRMNAVPLAVAAFFTSSQHFLPLLFFSPLVFCFCLSARSYPLAIFQSLAATEYPGQRVPQCTIVVPPCLLNAPSHPPFFQLFYRRNSVPNIFVIN